MVEARLFCTDVSNRVPVIYVSVGVGFWVGVRFYWGACL